MASSDETKNSAGYVRPQALVLIATVFICACSQNATRMDVTDMMPMQNATDSSVPDAQTSPTQWTTERVFNAMEPLCAQCHAEGQSLPFFTDLEHFRNRLVGDERWVVSGAPDDSALLDFLAGQGPGQFSQMPPTGPTYFELVEGDETKPQLDDLRDWIANLDDEMHTPMNAVCWDTPAAKALHRLNRLEYNHAIQALLEIDESPADDFPSEDNSYGLDNIADSLTVSPLLVEKYELAAGYLAERAIPSRLADPRIFVLEAEAMEGTVGRAFDDYYNLWSAGTITGEIQLEAAGEYALRVRVGGTQAGPDPVRYEVLVNGVTYGPFETRAQAPAFEISEVARIDLGAALTFIGIRFLNDYYCPQERFDQGTCDDVGDRNMHIDYVEVEGPFGEDIPATAFEQTFLRDCDLSEGQAAEACAQEAINRMARLIWRRPVQPAESERLWSLARAEMGEPDGLQAGIRQVLHALLLSPHFLFRVETASQPGERLGGYELASRLAAFLWRSVPDEDLLDAVASGRLDDAAGLGSVAAEMLDDDRSNAMVFDLGEQWLLTRQAALVDPEYELFPDFDEALRTAMLEETRMVFDAIWRSDRSILDIVDADFTYVNERLASHYGIPNISGDEFMRIELPQANRLGLLTQASWLSATSQRTRTSPVKRGKWVLEELLCSAPPPPPPSVEGLSEDVDQEASLRERLEQHRADPACAACHQHMDAVGFGLERFDAVGAYRDMDHGETIEPAGLLLGDDSFADAVGLAKSCSGTTSLAPACSTRC